MADLENVFIKEFKRNIRSHNVVKNIFDVPLPSIVKEWKVSGSELFGIKDIPSEAGLFSGLNKSIVKKLPKGSIASRRKVDLVTRDFVRDSNNRYVYEDVKIPSGSMVIISRKALELPYGYKSPLDGFGYIDFTENRGKREYTYYIPKTYIYSLHQTALVLSVKNMKNFAGMGYLSWNFGLIYLHIIPYKPNYKYVGTKVLKTGLKLNYSEEVKSIVDFWVNNDIIPNIALCDTVLEGNLVVKETSTGYENYEVVDELSLGEKDLYGRGAEDEENS